MANTNELARSSLSQDRALSLTQALTQDSAPAAKDAGTQASPRTDAIGIEIPVVLYASRNSATGRGVSKTLQPVREETRTVIVFAQGAVVRLSANLSVGEMVVLTNQQTGADVLCRVAAVKTQPGIQNYVDLEFTQRAPGFWEGGSAAGSSARTGSSASEPAARAAATLPSIPAPKQESGSPSWLAIESAPSASPVVPATRAPELAAAPIASTPLAAESPRSFPAAAVVPPSSNAVLGVSAGLQQSQANPSTLSGGRLDWGKQTAPKSKKGLWAAVAAVVVAGLVAGGFLLGRSRSGSSVAQITVAAPSAAMQPAAPGRAEQPQTTSDAASAPGAAQGSAAAPTWLPETPKHEQAQAEDVAQPVAPAPRRATIPVGNLAAPIAKTRVIASSSEPPPVLMTQGQDNAAAEGVLRAGVLSGASGVEAPTAFSGMVSTPVRPAGGRIQMPKLISSPEPQYPATARAQSAEGVVVIDALVDATGKVAEVQAISGPFVLRQAAMDAVRKWKYQPAQLDGQPTSMHMHVNIAFKLG